MADALRLYGLKVVVLAGASSIGEAISRTMVKHGAAVLALDSEASHIDSIYKSVRGISGKALDCHPESVGKVAVGIAKAELGGIDIIVNYVELPQESPVSDADNDTLQVLLEARSTIYNSMVAAALPLLKKSPAGRVISVGFVRSVFSIDGESGYQEAHTSLADFTQELAGENGQFGISANYVQPGAIMTAESRRVYSAATDLRDFCIRRSAASRLGETVDVAKVVLFLATDDVVFVSGTGIVVDGGRAPASGKAAL